MIPPLALAILAAALRLWAIELAPFGYDEVDVLGRARAVLGGELTATGPLTSWGIPDPPASVYLMVPPSALPRPALAGAAWSAVLNVTAVVLTYLVARRFLGSRVALVAGLLYAVNPWAVYFSRRTWAEIVPLFTVVALWAAFEVVCGGRARWAVLFFLALALQVQTRVLALVYVPAAVLTLALFPRRWGWRWPMLGVALGVLVSLPYLGWVGLHWSELQARLAEGNRGIALAPAASSGRGATQLLLWTAAGYGLLPAASAAAPWLSSLGLATALTLWTVAALLVAGLGIAVAALVRRPGGWEPLALSAIWLLPVGVLLVQSSSVYLHYMVAVFPAVFLVLALPLALLLGGALPGRLIGGALLGLVCGPQLATTFTLYRVVAAYHPESSAPLELRQAAAGLAREAADLLGTGERYGVEVPLRFWEALGDHAHAEAARLGLDEVWVLAGATDPLTAERPALLDYLLRPRLTPRFLAPETLMFPVGRPALVLETPDVDPPESLERFGERRAHVPIPSTNRVGRDFARLTAIPSRTIEDWAALPPTRAAASFEGGVQLLGFRATRDAWTRDELPVVTASAGDEVPVVTYWRVGGDAGSVLPPSVRLVDERRRQVAESRAPAGGQLASPLSRGERVVIVRQELKIPSRAAAGSYRLEVSPVAEAGGRPRRIDAADPTALLTTARVLAR